MNKLPSSRRRFLSLAAGGLAALAGCLNGDDPPDKPSQTQRGTSTHTRTTTSVSDTPPPPTGGPSGPVSVIVAADYSDNVNEKMRKLFYKPEKPVEFAVSYWENAIDDLDIDVTYKDVDQTPDSQANVVIYFTDIVTTSRNSYSEREHLTGSEHPIAIRDPIDGDVNSSVNIYTNLFLLRQLQEFGLRTAFGAALGFEYESGTVMDPRFQFTPQEMNDFEDEFRPTATEIRETLQLSKKTKRTLICGSKSETQEKVNELSNSIDSTIESMEAFIPKAEDYPAPLAVTRLKKTINVFDSDLRAVVTHIQSQIDENANWYIEDGAPPLHMIRHRIHDQIKPSGSVTAGAYKRWLDMPVNIRLGADFDPSEHKKYSEVGCN